MRRNTKSAIELVLSTAAPTARPSRVGATTYLRVHEVVVRVHIDRTNATNATTETEDQATHIRSPTRSDRRAVSPNTVAFTDIGEVVVAEGST